MSRILRIGRDLPPGKYESPWGQKILRRLYLAIAKRFNLPTIEAIMRQDESEIQQYIPWSARPTTFRFRDDLKLFYQGFPAPDHFTHDGVIIMMFHWLVKVQWVDCTQLLTSVELYALGQDMEDAARHMRAVIRDIPPTLRSSYWALIELDDHSTEGVNLDDPVLLLKSKK